MSLHSTFDARWSEAGLPDPDVRPELYAGTLWRRAAAYLIDAVCIGAIAVAAWILFALLTVVSFGLLAPGLWFLFGLIPLAYHTFLVSGRHAATFGMRAFGLRLSSWDGARPVFLQALAHVAVFYVTVGATGSLILLFALFNRRHRTLHDLLTGMVMLRSPAA
ncbi:MAG TPA: RDD family protein [Stellaceae bacterium]|jgi:uncharacterized RDD family membrane protein YckC|nr:RDD family protein [Stellaceae bacterium]